MAELSREDVLRTLATVIHPERGSDVVSLQMISGVVVKGSNVGFSIEVDPREAPRLEPPPARMRGGGQAPAGRDLSDRDLDRRARAGRATTPPPPSPGPQSQGQKPLVPGVAAIVAVASGKGGVGKSTTAVNLAMGMAAIGLRVGLLDADIYGPSIPRMTGCTGRPQTPDGKRLEPMVRHGVKIMSMGFMVEEDATMIWRGPMVQSAIQQMLGDVTWGDLDVLVVDLPPGTGDAQLTMAQRVPLTGAVIVSTPQDIALLDARKAINMFKKVNVPILGIVENMSYFCCPNCGHRSDIFAHGGARETAKRYEVEFLAEVPLELAIRETSDGGEPIVVSRPESHEAAIYRQLAMTVRDQIAELTGGRRRAFPRIVWQ